MPTGPAPELMNGIHEIIRVTADVLEVPKAIEPLGNTEALPNANRNKRKGFFREMNNIRGVRTVFEDADGQIPTPGPILGVSDERAGDVGEPGEASGSLPHVNYHSGSMAEDVASVSAINATRLDEVDMVGTMDRPNKRQRHQRQFRHQQQLVPSSELTELPSNVFVTSVHFHRPRPDEMGSDEDVAGTDEHGAEAEAEEVTMNGNHTVNGHRRSAEDIEPLSNGYGSGDADADRLEQVFTDVEARYELLPLITKTMPLQDITKHTLAWKVSLSSQSRYSRFGQMVDLISADSGARAGHDHLQPTTSIETRQSLPGICKVQF